MDVKIKTEDHEAMAVVSQAHTNISEVKVNGEVVYRNEPKTEAKDRVLHI